MRHLCCARCARVLIADFWIMVRDETEPTFSQVSLTCPCGRRTRVDLTRQRPAVHKPARVHAHP